MALNPKQKRKMKLTGTRVRPLGNVQDGTYQSPYKHYPVQINTITPEQYSANPERWRLVDPQAAYGYEAGRKAGTLKPGFSWQTLPQLTQEESEAYKSWVPTGNVPWNDQTRGFYETIKRSNPWYTETMFQEEAGNFLSNMGGQYPTNGSFDEIDRIMQAIGQIESGSDYTRVNENDPSGAFGKYQILGSNIPSWTAEALGRTLTPQQFLNDPQAQDATARYWIQKYYNQYGSADAVARAWNAGPGYATNPNAVTGYVAKFNNALGNITNPGAAAMGNGGWVLPFAGANVSGAKYGYRNDPYTGQQGWHGAVDLAVAAGTTISAATGGQVLYAGYDGSYGNTVVIADPTGQYHIRYAHLNAYNVQPGAQVYAGMPIGAAGSTGRSTGPHLHMEVRTPDGRYVDPRPFF